MKIDNKGIDFIISFEGFSAKACKCVDTEKYYTIGYGHYGPDVKSTDKITKKDAKALLLKDIAGYETAVNNLKMDLKQSSFNALVSFAYNCGVGNLSKLCTGRTLKEISEKILLYDKSGGQTLKGLTRRREAESELIKTDLTKTSQKVSKYFPKYTGKSSSIVEALKSLNIDATFTYRKKIATANNIKDYSGLGTQNTKLVELLKNGKLIKP